MAVTVLYNPQIVVNSVDLSAKASSAKVTFQQMSKAVTAFGDVAEHFITSLAQPAAEVTFYLDRASGSVVQTLTPLIVIGAGGLFPISIRPVNSAATTSNQVYTMTVLLDGAVDLISGKVGDVESVPIKFKCASGTGWAVATTS